MAKEISHITIYKENSKTLTKLVHRICQKHQCTVQDALDALNILFKNSVAEDFEAVNESVDSLFNYSFANNYKVGDKICYSIKDPNINDGEIQVVKGQIADHFGDGVFIMLDKPISYFDEKTNKIESTDSFDLYDDPSNETWQNVNNLYHVEDTLSESLLSPSDFMKLYEKKESLNDILYGHSIQLPKGICKIEFVDGDVIHVKCQDGSKDKVSYKEYFGKELVTEAIAIDDVTQYGDNLLVTLNGHLCAYQPIKDSGKSVEDLLKSVKGMMKYSVGKALSFLKKNATLVPETSKKAK